ncbi:hypothetical protein [Nocardioides luteus]|uniref:hypothetical protein n=1 Tax=Nocardioides luteus TaxID=1844 RepID=UPI0018CB12D2|nr:hypothetical protein [Nocardioides luteus]MBG6098470.1 hypothetical protein [Nocardioides luteus]
MRTSGIYFDYGGHEFKQFFAGDNWVCAAISRPDESRFPDALEFGETRGQHWVKLPKATIEDRRKMTVHATWRGAAVTVDAHVTESEVVLGYVGPPQRATDLGMDGDQYMGWTVIAPADELENLSIDIRRL